MFDQNKIKIMINTQPRSGSRFLVNEMIKNLKLKDNQIYSTSAIELFEKPYNQYKQINILRNPEDSIISWCAQNRFFNKPQPDVVFSNKEIKNHKDFRLDRNNVLHCINLFENFYKYLIKNHNNLFFIKYDQLIKETDLVIHQISKEYKIELRNQKLNNFILYDSFSTNFLKTSKNIQEYNMVKNDIIKYKDKIKELYKIHMELHSYVIN
jgi:hypothetical protein